MRTERANSFADLEGTLMRFAISTGGTAWESLKDFEKNVEKMTSLEIRLITKMLDAVIMERDRVVKEKVLNSITDLKF